MPSVSIILPTYNRARFLPEAVQSIREQQFTDWELIIIDDGSTDDTPEVVRQLTAGLEQTVKYVQQENQGPYGARNTGLDHTTGEYIAFFDSDDIWLPHHLLACVEALQANADVDWVYGASRLVDLLTNKVISENCFLENGVPRPFCGLTSVCRGDLNVIVDEAAPQMAISYALYCGLQVSVIRQRVFCSLRLPAFRVGEDQVFSFMAMKAGFRFAYFGDVHCIYRVHDGGISAGSRAQTSHRVGAMNELARAFESLLGRSDLTSDERKLLRKRIGSELFWNVGYPLHEEGRIKEARRFYRRSLGIYPFVPRMWKSFAASYVKQMRGLLCPRMNAGS